MNKIVNLGIFLKVVTFEEFVEYGKKHSDNIVFEMPWSFEFEGEEVTHSDDECYLIPIRRAMDYLGTARFTINHLLLIDEMGEFYLVDKDTFRYLYYEE